jgi:hypothetical protein
MSAELQLLFGAIRQFDRYPSNIKRICGNEQGNIFFPGGKGIFDEETERISDKEIMITGYQFDRCLDYLQTPGIDQQISRTNTAWANLMLLLCKGGVDPGHCFFTNAVLGVQDQNGSANKPSPVTKRYFLEHCRSVFRMELEIQKPRMIIVLGLRAARFLSLLHPKLEGWATLGNFTEADRKMLAVMEKIPLTATSEPTLVLLVHPAGRQGNIRHRKYGSFTGDNAEIRLLSFVYRGT